MKIDRRTLSIIVAFLIVLIAGGAVLFMVLNSNSAVPSGSTVATSSATDSEGNTIAPDDVSANLPVNPVDFVSLQEKNPEIFGWIKVPDTNIDYPLLQSTERDDFYLHQAYDKSGYSFAGSIYMEYCNSTEMTDRVSVLYGHNMIDGSMFANLHKFEDTSFFNNKKHRYFYIYTPTRKLTYEVVSAYEYDNRHIMNSFNFAENDVFENYLKYIQNPRSVVRNVRTDLDHELSIFDKIVTLSTCVDVGDGRYLLQGVLVKDEFTR